MANCSGWNLRSPPPPNDILNQAMTDYQCVLWPPILTAKEVLNIQVLNRLNAPGDA